MSEKKRFEFWADADVAEILDTQDKGGRARYVNEAIRTYAEGKGAFSDEKAAKAIADRISVHLLKKLKID